MYLVAARLQARRGMVREAAEYVAESRELLSSVSGIPFYAWAGVAGVPLGTWFLSARVESIEQYMAANMAVTGSDDYHAQTKKAIDKFEGPTEMALGQVLAVAGEMGDEPQPMVVVTTATMASGHQADAIGWGVEMTNYATEVTGTNGIFTSATVGGFSDVSWIQGHDDAASIDRALEALMPDAGYMERIGKAGDLFVSGSGQRWVMAKLP